MKRVFAFHGTDHKTGTTIISQSVAQLIAEQNNEINVLFLVLAGRKNGSFLNKEVKTIDDYKLQMDSRLVMGKEFLRASKYKNNFYALAGLAAEQELRTYFPETINYLLEAVADSFQIIIADTGSELDDGIALGGLCAAEKRYLVSNQFEAGLQRFEEQKGLFHKSGIKFDKFILNQFSEGDVYSDEYIQQRMKIKREEFFKVRELRNGRQAEREQKTFLDLREESYRAEIGIIANDVLEDCGFPVIKRQRKSRIWKNFI